MDSSNTPEKANQHTHQPESYSTQQQAMQTAGPQSTQLRPATATASTYSAAYSTSIDPSTQAYSTGGNLSTAGNATHMMSASQYASQTGSMAATLGQGSHTQYISTAGSAYSQSPVKTSYTQAGAISSGAQYQGSAQYQVSSQKYQTTSVMGNSAAAIQERLITGQSSVIAERVIEHEIKIPKKVLREEIIEKVVVVPEKVVHEEIVEEVCKVREKIVEVAKPVIKERIVEVPEIKIIEKIVEVPQIIYKERVKQVPRVEVREKIVEIPNVVYQEKIREIPKYVYKEVPVEKIIEVPEIKEEIVYKDVHVPKYIEKPVPEYVTVEVPQDVDRFIPVPVEATTTFEFLVPKLEPKYQKIPVPIYVPRFVEVPVPAELMDANMIAQAEHISNQISLIAAQQAPSLCEIENLAQFAKDARFQSNISVENLQSVVEQAWKNGTLNIQQSSSSMQYTTTSHMYSSGMPATMVSN